MADLAMVFGQLRSMHWAEDGLIMTASDEHRPEEIRMPPQRGETRQHGAVIAGLDDVDSFVSAQQLYAQLREAGDGVGLATVYRALQQLAEEGAVDVLRTADSESMYRRRSSGHHHLVCWYCRCTVEVDSAAVERWARKIGDDSGFVDVDHVVEVSGTCADCAATLTS